MEEGGARLAEVNSWAEAEFVRKMSKGWVAAEEKGEAGTIDALLSRYGLTDTLSRSDS